MPKKHNTVQCQDLRISHTSPVYPSTQSHVKSLVPSGLQFPPFRHGLGSHGVGAGECEGVTERII